MPDDELVTIDAKTGALPASRVKDCESARAIVKKLWDQDRDARADRRILQDMLRGEPPLDQADLDAAGRGSDCNDNWLGGRARVNQALAPYHGLVTNAPRLCEAEVDFGRGQARLDYGEIKATGLNLLFGRWWKDGTYQFQELCRHFVTFGLGFGNQEHPTDWRYRALGRDDVLFPRPMRPTVTDCMLYAWVRDYREDELADWIKDPKKARARGYNVKEVRAAIRRAADASGGSGSTMEDYRDNGFGISYKRDKPRSVRLFHLRVREFDQKISEVVGELDGSGDYLFKSPRRLESMHDAVTLFTYDLGDGTLHGIDGLADMIFATTQTENQTINRMVDYTRRAMSNYFQFENERDKQEFVTIDLGADTVVPSGVKFIERAFPNLGSNGIPFLNLLGTIQANNTGLYPGRDINPGAVAQTLGEAQQKAVMDAVLGTAAHARFKQQYGDLLNAQVRRLGNRNYGKTEPGYALQQKFKTYCLDQGMPEEAFYAECHVTPNFAVGGGSAAVAQQVLDKAMAGLPLLDPPGQHTLKVWYYSELLGRDRAKQLLPAEASTPRTSQQAINAETENAFFGIGQGRPVHPDDDHFVHADTHLKPTDAVVAGAAGRPLAAMLAAMVQQQGDPAVADKLDAGLKAGLPHIGNHLQTLNAEHTSPQGGKDTAHAKAVRDLNLRFNKAVQFAQKLDGFLQGQRAQAAQRQRQQQQAQAPAPGQSPALTPEQVQRLQYRQAEHEQDLTFAQQDAALDVQAKQAKTQAQLAATQARAQVRQAIDDAKGAADIRDTPSPPQP